MNPPELPRESKAIPQLLAELQLISHAPIQGYEFAPSEVGQGQRWRTSQARAPIPHLGTHSTKSGDTKKPRGSDVDDRPYKPRRDASEAEWQAYDDDSAAWKASYHSKTVAYFQQRIAQSNDLEAVRVELQDTISAWKRTPIPPGQPPAMADPQWKRWIANCGESTADLVRWYGVSRQYIHRIKRDYADDSA